MPEVMITGAGRGFGRSLLEVYLKRGWKNFPLVRDIAAISELTREFSDFCCPIVGDVSQDSIMDKITKVLEKEDAALDLLINNAGNIRKVRGIADAAAADLIDHFNVHCAGVMRCTKAALPFLRKAQKPLIINVSSRWGSISRTAAGQGGLIYAYQIAKAAQNMLSACLNQELREERIGVLAVHPGRLKTEVAAYDADVDPDQAALKLAEWAGRAADYSDDFKFFDLMNNTYIDW